MFHFSEEKQPAVERYVSSIKERYNYVQVLGMREPVPLKSLYVRVNILEKISNQISLLRPEDLDAFFDADRRAFGKKQETVDGEIIVNKLRKFIVLGKPGAGKTTYLKYLTLMMLDADSQIEDRKLPVFVTLREWADTRLPLSEFIAQQFADCGLLEAAIFVENMLRKGICLVLFDGLDEVSELVKQDEIIRQIKDFSEIYFDNQFIISCRVAAYNHWFGGFTEIEMADFNEMQMETFISNWFHREPKVARECWERLKSSPPLRELASVPLLLTLLCLEYGESNDFPPNRAELYHRAIEALLTKWDSTRRIRRPEVYKKLSTKQKESMFARIAAGTFVENQYFILERNLVQMIENFIQHLPGFPESELEPNSKATLKAIEAQHGIFVERAKGIYSFAHLTFQEYFTAKYIVDKRENTLGQLVKDHFNDPKWKEVFLLVAGLLDSADELLLRMHSKAKEEVKTPEIHVLMRIAATSLLSHKDKYPRFVRISFATFIAFDLARILEPHRLRDLVLELALALDRTVTLDRDLALARARTIAQTLDLDLLESYGQMNNLNKEIILEMQSHFSSNLLIINCMNSANFVSKHVREKILNEMFQPKE